MGAAGGLLYRGDRAILATMHAKGQVVAPIVERFLALRLEVTTGVNTDAFGSFSRDIERTGSQLDAARVKIEAAFELQVMGRALRRSGWAEARQALVRETELLRDLSRERSMNFSIIKGVKWPHALPPQAAAHG